LYPFYLPFVQSMVRYACGVSASSRNLLPGDAIAVSFDEPMESISLYRNEEKLAVGEDKSQVRFTETQQPGVYRVEGKGRGGKVVDNVAWRGMEVWPVALLALGLAAGGVAIFYGQQGRVLGGVWRWLLPGLRASALVAIAISILRPVLIRAKSSEEQGAVVVLF